jgi:release factor glutamine methyltransferase
LSRAAAALRAAEVPDPAREARLLLAHALGCDAADLLDRGAHVDPGGFGGLVARRARREPLALITGSIGFWTLDLEVSPATLIPRADSETLIEAALEALPDRTRVRRILDLGTGTGCLLLAALGEYPGAWGVGVDRSAAAVALAARNAARNGLASRAVLVCADWTAAFADAAGFDLVLSNPPYVARTVVAGLMPEVSCHEPRSALDGGEDGLDAYRAILHGLPALLRGGGVAVLELGQGQGGSVAAIAAAHGLAVRASRVDLGGVERAMVLGHSVQTEN